MHSCHVEKGLRCDSQYALAIWSSRTACLSARLSRDLFGPRREKLLCVRLDTEQERVTMQRWVRFACLTAQNEHGANADGQDFQHFMPKGWRSVVSENRQFLFFVLRYINLQTTLEEFPKCANHHTRLTISSGFMLTGQSVCLTVVFMLARLVRRKRPLITGTCQTIDL
jgi:hypothetical protein